MSSIGLKLKNVFARLGTSCTVIKAGSSISGEYIDTEANTQITKPFIREHFLEFSASYDTTMDSGDILRFDISGETDNNAKDHFLVMNLDRENFKNQPIASAGVLYKTNKVVNITRPSGELDLTTYQEKTHWVDIAAGERVLLTDKLYGTRLDDEEQFFMQSDIKALQCYVRRSAGVVAHDRLTISGESINYGWDSSLGCVVSGEVYYAVKYVERNAFRGVDVVYLEEDTRPKP